MPRKARWICLGVAVLVANTFGLIPAAHAQGKWANVAPFPDPREEVLGAAAGGKMYVFAGLIPLWHPAGLVYAYDPRTNTWRERASMPTPRNHAAVGVVNGKIYVIGGRVGAAFISLASDVSLVEVYDPATDTWGTPGARMPTTRSALAYGVYNNRIYIAGGEFQDPIQQTTFRSFEEYDPATNSWAILPPMAIARHGVASAIIGNRFYAVGGDVQASGTGVEVSTAVVAAFEFPR